MSLWCDTACRAVLMARQGAGADGTSELTLSDPCTAQGPSLGTGVHTEHSSAPQTSFSSPNTPCSPHFTGACGVALEQLSPGASARSG